jgi:hypothetical protein
MELEIEEKEKLVKSKLKEENKEQKISYKEAVKDDLGKKKNFIDPIKMVENIAMRLKNYDMYTHAKTYEAYSLEAILADDLEMPKPEDFFKNLQQDSDSEGNNLVPEEVYSM